MRINCNAKKNPKLKRRSSRICGHQELQQEYPTEPILKIAAPQAKLCWLANLRLRQNPGWDGISSRKFAGNFVKYRSVAGKICFLLAGRRKKQTTTQINTQR